MEYGLTNEVWMENDFWNGETLVIHDQYLIGIRDDIL